MSVSENNKRIAKNSTLLYFRMFIVMCIQLYTSRVILKTLGVENFGIYNVVGGIVTMFAFLNGALGSATSRYFTFELGKGDYNRLKKVFNIAMINHVIMASIIFILAETIGLWLLNEKLIIPAERFYAAMWVYQISILTAILSLTQVPYTASIIAHEKMNIYAYMGLIDVTLKFFLAISVSDATIDKLIYYALGMFLIQLVSMITYRIYCSHNYRECRFKRYNDKKLQREMLRYASYDLIGSASVMAQGQGLNIVLNIFTGPAVNAARAIAYQVEGAANQFSNNFLTAVNPQIIKYYAQDDIPNMMKLVKQSSIFTFALMSLIVVPLSLEMKTVLTIWLGEYPDYSVQFTILALVISMLNAFRRPRITIFHATGHIKLSNIVTGSILCLALPVGYILMRVGCSPISVFIGTLACTIIADVSNLYILKKYIKYSVLEFITQVHFKCLLLLLVVLAFVYPIHIYMYESFIRLLVVIFATLLVASIMIWNFYIPNHLREKIITKFISRR